MADDSTKDRQAFGFDPDFSYDRHDGDENTGS